MLSLSSLPRIRASSTVNLSMNCPDTPKDSRHIQGRHRRDCSFSMQVESQPLEIQNEFFPKSLKGECLPTAVKKIRLHIERSLSPARALSQMRAVFSHRGFPPTDDGKRPALSALRQGGKAAWGFRRQQWQCPVPNGHTRKELLQRQSLSRDIRVFRSHFIIRMK